jgi:hypothetical protein
MNRIDIALSRAVLDAAGIESAIEIAHGKPDIVTAKIDGFHDDQEITSLDMAIIRANEAILRTLPMRTYRVAWESGRERNAIGIFYPGSVTVQALDPHDALMQAYKTHDHIQRYTITEIEPEGGEA